MGKKFVFSLANKGVLKIITLFAGAIIIVVSFINIYISLSTEDRLYDDVASIPKNRVGLLLGTAKHLEYDKLNPYYQYRVNAASDLYKAGKIEFILVSGDNSLKDYNEPLKFKIDLIKQGIPEDKIYLDYAGFRTLASVVRAKKIFGLSSFTIISQKHHNQRALFLTDHFNIHAVAFNAQDIYGLAAAKTQVREFFARAKAVLDIIFGVEPKYLGKPIKIK